MAAKIEDEANPESTDVTESDDEEIPDLDQDLVSRDFVGLNLDILNPCPNIGTAGYIVLDLETDGLLERKQDTISTPRIVQVAFGPLEMPANKIYVTNFYVENNSFISKLAVTNFLKVRYEGYDVENKVYTLKNKLKRKAVPLEQVIDYIIKWKEKLYGPHKPIFLISHNAERFDKVVFEHHLKRLELWDRFKSAMHFMGWIDSLHLIRSLPCIGHVLGFPEDTVPHPMKKPFSLQNMVWHLKLKASSGEPFTLHYAENDVEALIQLLRKLNFHTLLSLGIILE